MTSMLGTEFIEIERNLSGFIYGVCDESTGPVLTKTELRFNLVDPLIENPITFGEVSVSASG